MAKLDKSGIASGKTIQASSITNIYDALGGSAATDIMVSGTLSAMSGISLSGNIIPQSACASDVGSATYPIRDLHLSGSTIYMYGAGVDTETFSRTDISNLKAGKGITKISGIEKPAQILAATLYGYADGMAGNTYVQFKSDRITAKVGGITMLDLDENNGEINIGEHHVMVPTGSITSGNVFDGIVLSGDTYIRGALSANSVSAGSLFYSGTSVGTFATGIESDISSLKSATGSILGGSVNFSKLRAVGGISANNLMYGYDGYGGTGVKESIESLLTATGSLNTSISNIKTGASTGNYSAWNLTANKLYLRNPYTSSNDLIIQYGTGGNAGQTSLSAGSVCAGAGTPSMDFYQGSTRLLAPLETATGNLKAVQDSLVTATGNIIAGSEHFTSINGAILSGGANSVAAGSQQSSVIGYASTVGSSGDADFSNIFGGFGNNIKCGDYNAILGGRWQTITAHYSAVLGGKSCDITHNYAYSMGNSIDSVSANTTHVDQLYAKNLPTSDPSVSGILYTRTGAQLGLSASVTAQTFVMVSKG